MPLFEVSKEIYDIAVKIADGSAEYAPVVHGRWIYTGARGRFPACECSVCGNAENADWAILGDNVNYCPNCGARMDEEANDD